MAKVKKTHEEYMALAKVLGEHIGVGLGCDPVLMAVHFMSNPSCPLCLEDIAADAVLQGKMRIKEAAIIHGGKIWTGRRHHEVIKKIIDDVGASQAPILGEQGFVTECGRFLGREAAAIVAFEAGQIPALKRELFSEDLY